ncbi:MAG: sensor histidine kinase, partial [Clostridium sp.]
EQEIIINGEINTYFIGDINWSVEALVNIIKNCVDHTGLRGRVEINFSQNPLYTKIVISDNGSGIDNSDLPYIFRRFYKGKNSSDDSVGIGLSMARTIIKNQGGDISVKSRVGCGTKFTIKIYKKVV